MTSNPAIFEKVIVDSHDYDEDIRALVLKRKGVEAIYEALSQRDVLDQNVAFIAKPFTRDELAVKVREVLTMSDSSGTQMPKKGSTGAED